MKIIEKFSQGKKNQETNEDAIIVTSKFAAVVDGATSKSKSRIDIVMANGRYATSLICQAISKMPAEVTCEEFCNTVTNSIYQVYRKQNLVERVSNHPEERLTASVALFSFYHHQIWMIGDCQVMIDGILYTNPKPSDAYLSGVRADFIKKMIKTGTPFEEFYKYDAGRNYIMPLLIDSCSFQNNTTPSSLSFSVVDGFHIDLNKVVILDIPSTTSEIVLASDGYPKLFPTLEQSEDMLNEQLELDPLCIERFKSTKGVMQGNVSFDDRSYLRIKL
jgi:hypothetical protein